MTDFDKILECAKRLDDFLLICEVIIKTTFIKAIENELNNLK